MNNTTEPRPITLAFAGIGHPHAPGWVRAIRDVPGVTLAGAWDPEPARLAAFAAEHDLPVLTEATVLGPGIDGIVINGRNDEAAPLARAALAAGKPVFTDKPGAATSDELRELIALAGSTGLPFHVAYFVRQASPVQAMRQALAAGSLGRVSLVRLHVAMPAQAWESMHDWFADPTNVTSIFQEDACHMLDVVYLLFGLPRAVVAAHTAGHFRDLAGEDTLAAILEYPSHLAVVDFTAHEATPWVQSWTLEVYGDRATVRAGLRPEWIEWHPAPEIPPTETPRRSGREDDHAQHLRAVAAFLAALDPARPTEPPPATGPDGLAVFTLIDAIRTAAHGGQRVLLPETP